MASPPAPHQLLGLATPDSNFCAQRGITLFWRPKTILTLSYHSLFVLGCCALGYYATVAAAAAAEADRSFQQAWRLADVRLLASAFWFPGPDTTSCECQRDSAGGTAAGGKLRGLPLTEP